MVAVAELYMSEEDLSFAAFYRTYGEVCGIERDTLEQIWLVSEKLMPPVDSQHYGYHNAAHSARAAWAIMEASDRAEAEQPGLILSRRMLVLAALFHDVHYDRLPTEHKSESKEEYSAHVMATLAPGFGFTEAEVRLAKQIIMVTKRGTEPRTPEEVVMIEADLWNMGEDFDEHVVPSFVNLAKEDEHEKQLKNEPFNYREFGANSIKVLCGYLIFLNKSSDFFTRAAPNVLRLAAKLASEQNIPLRKYLASLQDTAVDQVLGRLPFRKD